MSCMSFLCVSLPGPSYAQLNYRKIHTFLWIYKKYNIQTPRKERLMPSGHVHESNVCQIIHQHMKRDGHCSHFSAENYFSNSCGQHLKLHCHHISQIHSSQNWTFQLHRSCSPVAVKQKHRLRVKTKHPPMEEIYSQRGIKEPGIAGKVLFFIKQVWHHTRKLWKWAGIFCSLWKELLLVAFDMLWVCVGVLNRGELMSI